MKNRLISEKVQKKKIHSLQGAIYFTLKVDSFDEFGESLGDEGSVSAVQWVSKF